jgi:ATP-dependent Clp protease ATP-binding subunit ClpA
LPDFDSEHLLLGVVESDQKLLDSLVRHPSSAGDIRREVERRTAICQQADSVHIPLSNESKRILKHAAEESARLQHESIGTGHFLLGLLHEEKSMGASVLVDVLGKSGMRRDTAQKEIERILSKGPVYGLKT